MQIKWTDFAQTALQEAMDYVRAQFGDRTAATAYARIMSYQPLLTVNPWMGIVEPTLESYGRGYRSLLVHKHHKLIYLVDEQSSTIIIIDFWDNRSNPATLVARINTE